ncbi:Lin0512 family protein [Salirhabdus sp. Marseille-P4669]|uniref:Lin0512 family protein n=1 Tax=Salirhabdus sp. Marseille-P4669 TaxID=2042310 RepID=UPI000C799805|nr:Lin0512 family protein [Salirhabdus sp. Marseille-P4669]
MEKLLFIETGMGIDVHGQNITKASVRAVQNAIHFNSMPGIKDLLPGQDLHNMHVNVKLAIPADKEKLDKEAIKNEIPYGTVTIDVMDGGMATTSGIVLKDKEDVNDLMYIVIASVEVGY